MLSIHVNVWLKIFIFENIKKVYHCLLNYTFLIQDFKFE